MTPVTNFFTVLGLVTGAFISVGVILRPIYKRINEFVDWAERFRRDWEGEEEEPGRDKVPGVMERLNRLDGELSHNGGSSLKDAVARTENIVVCLDERLERIERLLSHE